MERVVQILAQIVVAQQEHTALLKDYFNKQMLVDRWDRGMAESMHGRDDHGRYWNSEGAVKMKIQYDGELAESSKLLCEKLEQINQLFDDLKDLQPV